MNADTGWQVLRGYDCIQYTTYHSGCRGMDLGINRNAINDEVDRDRDLR
jgi:hypothetical protein